MLRDKENNIDLGLDLDTGIEKNVPEYISGEITNEEREIARQRGRDIEGKIKNDSVATGIANFRLLSKQ